MAAALQDIERLSPESWDWAEGVEAKAWWAADTIGEEANDIQRAVVVLLLRPGEEAFVEAAFSDARHAHVEELVAATRYLREKELRRLAIVEHLVDPDMSGFLGYVAGDTDSSIEEGYVPTLEEMVVAALVEEEAARTETSMARMASRLRRGTEEFAVVGEEALADALRRQAANVDVARATVEAFATSVRCFLATGSSRCLVAHAGAKHESFLTTYLILVVSIVP
ncbi:hypothetical protein SETIT_3G071800v2 [Setaria italica]|uniref:Uncharacterized protein n=1 Tax=Setaria italica TaxID=4555 RepID=A0A368QCM0_SETIT|nr:hypothetical protein SETIT_3G071800v2 [Setaria italica]